VQNLAGVSYTLSAAADGVRSGASQDASEMLEEAAAQTRRSMRELRTLMVDLYPPALERAGLGAALTDLVAPLSADRIQVDLSVDPALRLAPEKAPVLFRAAQEAVRNVQAHADAHRVRVAAARENGRVVLSVEDDGRGFDASRPASAGRRPRFGLRMLEDLARDAHGQLSVDSRPGQGTRVRLELPL
jgi:signal transduction histidine kinase